MAAPCRTGSRHLCGVALARLGVRGYGAPKLDEHDALLLSLRRSIPAPCTPSPLRRKPPAALRDIFGVWRVSEPSISYYLSRAPSPQPPYHIVASSDLWLIAPLLCLVLHLVTNGTYDLIQSDFAAPCVPLHIHNSSLNGFNTNPRPANNGTSPTTFELPITSNTTTIWFY